MTDKPSQEFESRLQRLEALLVELESPQLGLDRSVELFREGKALVSQCDRLLNEAETAVAGVLEEYREPSS